MSKKNRELKSKAKEEDLYESSEPDIKYETVERNESAEKASIAYSQSWRGRFGAYISRCNLKSRQLFSRLYLFLKWSVIEFSRITIKGIDILRVFIYNEYCNKILRKDKNKMSKQDTTTTKNNNTKTKKAKTPTTDNNIWHGIMGIATLFVVVSIAHSAWVITQGTDDKVSLIMAVPMVLWAAVQLIKQFLKQGVK